MTAVLCMTYDLEIWCKDSWFSNILGNSILAIFSVNVFGMGKGGGVLHRTQKQVLLLCSIQSQLQLLLNAYFRVHTRPLTPSAQILPLMTATAISAEMGDLLTFCMTYC
jgi:hypothetical protein